MSEAFDLDFSLPEYISQYAGSDISEAAVVLVIGSVCGVPDNTNAVPISGQQKPCRVTNCSDTSVSGSSDLPVPN